MVVHKYLQLQTRNDLASHIITEKRPFTEFTRHSDLTWQHCHTRKASNSEWLRLHSSIFEWSKACPPGWFVYDVSSLQTYKFFDCLNFFCLHRLLRKIQCQFLSSSTWEFAFLAFLVFDELTRGAYRRSLVMNHTNVSRHPWYSVYKVQCMKGWQCPSALASGPRPTCKRAHLSI